jgi:hypothetical protein
VRGFNDLESVYEITEFLPMTFYFGAPYSTPEGDARAAWYGVSGTPNVMIGGLVNIVGGTSGGSMYETYNPIVQDQLSTPSPLIMVANYTKIGDDILVRVDIEVDMAVSGSDNQVLFFVCQEGLHDQSNMVVDMLANEPFSLTTPGETVTVERTFTMDAGWNEPDLRLIVLVQDMSTKEIHQATQANADYAARVIVDVDPDGVEASWHLTGPDLDINQQGDLTINLWSVGSYTITWEDIPYWITPANNPETLTVGEDGTITFLGAYGGGPFDASVSGDLGHAGPGQAVSLVDVDNDGHLDIHVANDGEADQLLHNDGSGNFSDIATGAIAETGASRGAAWADINGDGFLDVAISRFDATNLVMLGDGTGGFTAATVFGMDQEQSSLSASWVDYDLDGLLDLYIVNDGEENSLLRCLGVTPGPTVIFAGQSGEAADDRNGNAACWADGDLDGYPDLFIANQFQTNVLLQNLGTGFNDMTQQSGLVDDSKSLGAAWGDYDNDGDFDLYVANEGTDDYLYRCGGTFLFSRMTGTNLGDQGYGRGVVWVDFNNDTFLDLYVVRNDQTDLMLLGDGAGNFQRVPVGPDIASGPGNAVACGDVDHDGDMDLFVSRDGASNGLLLNKLPNDNRWVTLHLTGLGNNTCAIGARVVLTAGGVSQMRMVTSGSGYLCNNAFDVHFGLGTSTQVEQIEIFWPDGTHETMGPATTNTTHNIVQGQGLPSPVDDGIPARKTALGLAHPNPFNPSTTIEFSLAKPEHARLAIYTIDGRHVRTLVDGSLGSGPQSATWDGTDRTGRTVGSGTYFFRLTTAGGFSEAGSMVLVK